MSQPSCLARRGGKARLPGFAIIALAALAAPAVGLPGPSPPFASAAAAGTGADNTAPGAAPALPPGQASPDNAPPSRAPLAEAFLPSQSQEAPLPSDRELSARGAVIGRIVIRNENIFDTSDPKENNWLFRLANTLHIKTRPSLVRSYLLFRPGDRYDKRLLDESERILRANRYFYDAHIRPVSFRDGRVDIEVTTRDVWTLRPGISFGRAGGANTSKFELSDTNVLGTGVGAGISHASEPDRSSNSVFVKSDHVAHTWFRASLLYSENSDGRKKSALVERPFYALDSRWATSASYVDDLRTDSLFGRAGVAGSFRTHATSASAWGGWSAGLQGKWVRRHSIGFTWDESRFAPAPGSVSAEPLPPDRTLSYPWAAFELTEDDFEKLKNRDQIFRTEDFFLGTRFRAQAGYSSDLFGADREAVMWSGQYGRGFEFSDPVTFLVTGSAGGRVESGSIRDALVSANGRLYVVHSESLLLFSNLTGARGINFDADHELTLGGDTGLRGYPRRYQGGDRSALFTLEGRYFTDYYPFRLVRIGAALFYDMGRAWGGGFAKAKDPGLLRDVGAGLRLALTRSGLGNVLHLDAAFPLDGDKTISRVQFVVTTRQGF